MYPSRSLSRRESCRDIHIYLLQAQESKKGKIRGLFLQVDDGASDVVEEPLLKSCHQVASQLPAKDSEEKYEKHAYLFRLLFPFRRLTIHASIK